MAHGYAHCGRVKRPIRKGREGVPAVLGTWLVWAYGYVTVSDVLNIYRSKSTWLSMPTLTTQGMLDLIGSILLC